MVADDIILAQAEESIMGTGAKDILVKVSTEKVLTVELVLKVTTQEIITAPNPEAPVVISVMRQRSQPAHVLWEGQMFHLLLRECLYCDHKDWIRKYSSDVDTAMDILEELTLQMVKQFFITMKYCIELVLSMQSFFEFA